MHFTIRILYLSIGIKVSRSGTFPSRGRNPEKVAADWINEIKKEMEVEEILKVEADGVDITSSITELE